VIPDVSITPEEFAPVARSIVGKNLIFDYATLYRQKHEQIVEARNFKINDEVFNDFNTYLADKEYSYETESEELLKKWEEVARKENYFDAASREYDQLKAKIDHDKKADVEKAREQISELLADEIASRYYFKRGRIETSFAFDPEITKAIQVLSDSQFYSDVLKGKYVEDVSKKGK
jgi:carboxyl-terminal processing protease